MSEFEPRQNRIRSNPMVSPARLDRVMPRTARAENPVLARQQALGNQVVQRFTQSCPLKLPSPGACPFGGACHACPAPVQAKLKVNVPGDKYEQEADRVADRVMHMPEPSSIQRACSTCDEEESIQAKPLAEQITPLVQRQVEPEEEEEKEEEPVQAKLSGSTIQRQGEGPEEEEEDSVRLKQMGGQTPQVGPCLQARVRSLKGSGQPLRAPDRAFFESRFGQNFDQVRVHADARAAEVAHMLGAKAFTLGKDVAFGGGQYAPDTASGKRLLAHELSHVVQQSGRACKLKTSMRSTPVIQRVTSNEKKKEETCGGKWTCCPDTPAACNAPDVPGNTGKSSSWKLVVKIDLEATSLENVMQAAIEESRVAVGHTYVLFEENTGRKFTYGWYPKVPSSTYGPVDGCIVHPDKTHAKCTDYELHFPLTEKQYNNALKKAQRRCWQRGSYHLLNENCTTFVREIVHAAGKTLPSIRGKVKFRKESIFYPGRVYKGTLEADNPNTLVANLLKKYGRVSKSFRFKPGAIDREFCKGYALAAARLTESRPSFLASKSQKARTLSLIKTDWQKTLLHVRRIYSQYSPSLGQLGKGILPQAQALFIAREVGAAAALQQAFTYVRVEGIDKWIKWKTGQRASGKGFEARRETYEQNLWAKVVRGDTPRIVPLAGASTFVEL